MDNGFDLFDLVPVLFQHLSTLTPHKLRFFLSIW